MPAEIGQFCLVVALLIAAAQSVLPLIGAHYRRASLIAFANTASLGLFGFVALAFACLVYAFYVSDFSLAVVAANSNSAMPTIFKLSATWGNHEGSMLLWVFILTVFGAAVASTGAGHLPAALKARVLAIQGMMAGGFLAFILFTSNPFTRLDPAPADGIDLNPLLQDIGLAIHPPFLYLGYVGFSIAFSFAIAALIGGRIDASWGRYVRPWILAAWCFLTIGITLGSFWAYYELGWGGWWFWDPVENASFMPWLVGTALLHSALVVERRQTLVIWTVLLAILTFSLSLVGTFLVRSGVLTSVHAFATDPGRGFGVLILLVLATGGGLALFAARAPTLGKVGLFHPFSREGGLVLNNILLVSACGTVLLGTFYPMFVEIAGAGKISVGAPYFDLTFVPVMVPLLLAMAAGPMLRWKRDEPSRVWRAIRLPGAIAIAAAIAVAAMFAGKHLAAAFGMGLAVWLVAGSIAVFTKRIRLFAGPIATSLTLARNTPRSFYGLVIAHAGMGLAVAGITAVSAWEAERIVSMLPGEQVSLSAFVFTLDKVERLPGPNYDAERAIFTVSKGGNEISKMSSERRFYPVRQSVTTEAGIRAHFLSNLYVAIGEANDQGKWTVRLYYHPLALLIWIGPIVMALGGFVSLSDRRFRVGAPQRSRIGAAAVAGA